MYLYRPISGKFQFNQGLNYYMVNSYPACTNSPEAKCQKVP